MGRRPGEANETTRVDELLATGIWVFTTKTPMLTECRNELDDRNLGLSDDLNALSEVGSTKDGGEGVKDGDLVLPVHAVRLNDEIDISARR